MDHWHWGLVAVVSYAVALEAWHGLCIYISDRQKLYDAQDQLPSRTVSERRFVDRFQWVVLNSRLLRSTGRLAVAGFVIAGYAAGEFQLPWIEANNPAMD